MASPEDALYCKEYTREKFVEGKKKTKKKKKINKKKRNNVSGFSYVPSFFFVMSCLFQNDVSSFFRNCSESFEK
jgi:hypothetical protein